ncbi:hypothetical protein [Bradyrhizobium sp. RT3a]|uniref:hypothetical protein n=1 Tax=unclassified Bradyrhizobium TaxID=2631580 RepID=UPI00339585DC
MRIVITLLLAIVPWSAWAQIGQNEKLGEIIAKLKACVRTHAPEVQAPAAKGSGNAVDYFIKVCSPPITDLDPANVGAVPPGIFRVTITEEWDAIAGETRTR